MARVEERYLGPDNYFDYMYAKWERAWERFGVRPELAGAEVLDLGCGLGAFSVHAAQEGARVTGIDLDRDSLEQAREIAARRFPELDVTYLNAPVEAVQGSFDLVITNEVLEHVVDLTGCLAAVRERLRPQGRFYAGWGPLWYSPTGGHQLTVKLGRVPVPWSHLVPALARTQAEKHTWTFNYLRPSQYRAIVEASGLRIESWRVNPGRHPAYRVLRVAARVAPTPFTANVYAVLRKDEPPAPRPARGSRRTSAG